jgi:outer membrane lipoprotein-sorting protein
MSKVWLRWTPAVAAVVVVTAVAIAMPSVADASVTLPSKTPSQVLQLVASSKVTALSGSIDETSDLGLPSISSSSIPSGSGGSSSLASELALLTGTNSLRVYVDGPKNVRLQVLSSLAESDVVLHGSDLWTYDSKKNTVEHATVTAPAHSTHAAPSTPRSSGPLSATPQGLADQLLAWLEPTSSITVGADVRVAGRPAYDLVLTPKATDTLLGSVSIAVDAATGLPLRVQLTAAGQQTPAVSIGFSSLDLSTPAASLFDFTPPAGATITQLTKSDAAPKPHASTGAKPTEIFTGHGWDAVVTVSAGSLAELTSSSEFSELTTAVAGGRVLHTSLVNILFTADGRVIAGSVSVARLQSVAAGS